MPLLTPLRCVCNPSLRLNRMLNPRVLYPAMPQSLVITNQQVS